ncbi:hypothetical protein RZS08_32410, partial [Arthrospira platensis SPKY1]|nr:hypothetical protein [Arthrospira platensis SPKY1]
MGVFGAIALPLHLGLAFVPLAIFAFVLYRRTQDEIVDEPAQFTAMMRTSSTVLEMMAPEAPDAVAAHTAEEPAAEPDAPPPPEPAPPPPEPAPPPPPQQALAPSAIDLG